MTPKIATTILEQYRRQQLVAAALRATEKRAIGFSDAGPGAGFNLSADAPLTNGPRKFISANVENKDGLDFFSTSGARQLGLAPGTPGRPAQSRFNPQTRVPFGQPTTAATAGPDPFPANPRATAARAIADNNTPPLSPSLAQDVADVQTSVQRGEPMPISMRPGPLDNLPTEYTQQPAPAPPPLAPGNAQYADANPDGSVNWDSERPNAAVPYTPPATTVAESSTPSGGEAHWAPLTPEQNQQLRQSAPYPGGPQPLARIPGEPGEPNTRVAPLPPQNPVDSMSVARPAAVDDMAPTPGGPQPLERVPAEAGASNAKADPAPISAPTPKPQHNPTQRYKTEQDAIKALENPNLDDEGRRLAAGKLVDSKMANIPAEDRAMLRSIANGETGDHVRAYLARGLDKFKQEQVAQAVQENPGMANNPQQFGSFMGQVENMWNSMGPYGQIASMIGIPAAVFGLMGGDGMSSILGGLGIGALGLGAGAMGFLGEGTQRSMGQLMGQAGNFFGLIPDEARNADLLVNGGDAAKQRIRAAMESAPAGKGYEAGQAALAAERAKFEPLQQMHGIKPELAYSYLMGMEGDARPKTNAEAKALYDRLQKQWADSGQEGYLQNQVYDAATEEARTRQSALPAWARVAAGYAAPYAPESVQGYLQDAAQAPDVVGRRYADRMLYGDNPPPEAVAGQEKQFAARDIVRRRVKQALAMSAMDQKELNDLKQQDPQTLDEKKVRRLKELQARQAADLPAAKVVTVCMKAARCWAGYEPVPGAKAYSRGSCRPVGSKKTQKEMKNGTERQHEKVKQSGAARRPQVSAPAAQRTGARTKTPGRAPRY